MPGFTFRVLESRLAGKVAVAAPAVFVLACLVGCGQQVAPPAPARGVAVIDLDAVAAELGRDKQIAHAVQQRQKALNDRLVQLANGYVSQLEQHREASKEEEANKVQLAQYQEKANKSLGQARRQAEQDLSAHRLRLVQQFRSAVRPVARKIAEEKGYSLIITMQDGLLLDYEPDADITGEVAAALKASQTPREPAPLPVSDAD